MKHTKRFFAVMCLMCTLIGTVTYPVTTNVLAAVSSQTIELNKTKLVLHLGQQKRLQLNGTNEAVTWKSSNKKVVRVTKRGIVKTRRTGSAFVTASIGNESFTCEVTVNSPVIIMEEYQKDYYYAMFSDGFSVEVSKGDLEFTDYKSYSMSALYECTVGAVYEQPLKTVTVKGYNTKTQATYQRVMFEKYSADWCDFQTNMYRYLDFDHNVREFGKYYCMADGYLVFAKKVNINAIKYNDGTHKLTLYFK